MMPLLHRFEFHVWCPSPSPSASSAPDGHNASKEFNEFVRIHLDIYMLNVNRICSVQSKFILVCKMLICCVRVLLVGESCGIAQSGALFASVSTWRLQC